MRGALGEFHEHAAEGGDAGASGEEDVVVFFGLEGQDEALAAGAGELDFVAWFEITEVVAGDACVELAGFPVFVDEAFDGGGDDGAFAVFAEGG